MEPISAEESHGKVMNANKDEGVQSVVYTDVTDNDDSMQKGENAHIEMGSSGSKAASVTEDAENSPVDFYSDCGGDNEQRNDTSDLSTDALAKCDAESEVNNYEGATNEPGFSENTAETNGETECEAVNQVLINEHDTSHEEVVSGAIDARERKRPDEEYDFDMELIIKSLTVANNKTPEREQKTKTATRSDRIISYSSEEEEEKEASDKQGLIGCKWPGCGVETRRDDIVVHERSCGLRPTLCK